MPPKTSTAVETQPKRAVNLALNEDLVAQAWSYAASLSAAAEGSVEIHVEQQPGSVRRREQADACSRDWNVAHDKIGSFADEHCTL